MENDKIPLSDMIRTLREELESAQKEGQNSNFKFAFDSVELELSVLVSRTGTGKAGIKFWVIDAGGEYQKENAFTHKFTLVLKPGSLSAREISNESTHKVSEK